jgi:hypothetical protein
MLLRNREHKASPSTTRILEPPLLVVQSGFHDIIRLRLHHGRKCHLMARKNRTSCLSLQNQTVKIKAWIHTIEYHPIRQTPTIRCIVIVTSGALRNSPRRPDQEEPASGRSPSSHKMNPRTTTFIRQIVRPSHRRPSPADRHPSTEEEASLSTNHAHAPTQCGVEYVLS